MSGIWLWVDEVREIVALEVVGGFGLLIGLIACEGSTYLQVLILMRDSAGLVSRSQMSKHTNTENKKSQCNLLHAYINMIF